MLRTHIRTQRVPSREAWRRQVGLLLPLLAAAGCGGTEPGFGGGGASDLPPIAEETLLVSFDGNDGLLVVDPDTGEGVQAFPRPANVEGDICSTVLMRDGRMFGSAGRSLYLIDPCTAEATLVGQYSDEGSICGLAAHERGGLYGLDQATASLVRVDEDTAELETIGPLGWEVGPHALTWDREEQRFLAVDGRGGRLMAVDPGSGASTALTTVSLLMFGVGAEKDPVTGEIYICTGPNLYSVDPDSGEVTTRGRIGSDDSCNDLGATWVEMPCLGD